MISDGRYGYHQTDIAELEAKEALSLVEQFNLQRMRSEVAEYEKAHNIPSTLEPTVRVSRVVSALSSPPAFSAGRIPTGTCKHGIENFCGFCETGSEPP